MNPDVFDLIDAPTDIFRSTMSRKRPNTPRRYAQLAKCCALVFLSGCGSGIHVSAPVLSAAAAPTGITLLVTIGNSITWHSPESDVSWSGDWGMAASNINADYAHLTATSLSLPLVRLNVASLESDPTTAEALTAQAAALITPSSAVVVELGDNAKPSSTGRANFQTAYHQLLGAVATGKSLVCTSTYWGNSSLDAIIQSECKLHNGSYTYIGDIYGSPINTDSSTNTFSNPFVVMHPHDWGMNAIAVRVQQHILQP
jgi:hypothetical protein